jgi:hypothetical protein
VLRYRVGLESREVSRKAAIEDGLLALVYSPLAAEPVFLNAIQ